MTLLILLLAVFLGVGFAQIVRLIVEDIREKHRAQARDRIRQVVKMEIPKNTIGHHHRARSGHPITMQSW